MKTFFYILLFFFSTSAYGQLAQLKGTWVSATRERIIIDDTTNHNNSNYLSNALMRHENFGLFISGNNLSFQTKYYSSPAKKKKLHVARYDLKILKLTDTKIELKPVSSLSRAFFQHKNKLVFTRQPLPFDTSIKFEKIIFHSSVCFGSCPVYHLQIDQSKSVLLNIATLYSQRSYQADSVSEGYFKGQLSDSSFNKLLTALESCNLRTLEMERILCCDGAVITIIVYFNGQRKYYKTMFPPAIAGQLIKTLYDICAAGGFTKVAEKFELEE